MKVRLSSLASAHLLAAYDYLQAFSPNAARSQLNQIFEAIDLLERSPYLGRKGRVAGTRELVVNRTPFIVAYAIVENEVQVLAVLHGARQWPESF